MHVRVFAYVHVFVHVCTCVYFSVSSVTLEISPLKLAEFAAYTQKYQVKVLCVCVCVCVRAHVRLYQIALEGPPLDPRWTANGTDYMS